MFQGVVCGLGCTVSKFNYTGVKLFLGLKQGREKQNGRCPILPGPSLTERAQVSVMWLHWWQLLCGLT